MAVMGVVRTLAPAPWPPVAVVALVNVIVVLFAEVVATLMLSLKAPPLKSLAESEERNVDVLSTTATDVEPLAAYADSTADGEGREVVALADALSRVAA